MRFVFKVITSTVCIAMDISIRSPFILDYKVVILTLSWIMAGFPSACALSKLTLFYLCCGDSQ